MDQAIHQTAVETSNVVELRQYTMQPDGRDKLFGMFEKHFVMGQEASGMRILGQFRDLQDPNRFVWTRCNPSTGVPCGKSTATRPAPPWWMRATSCS